MMTSNRLLDSFNILLSTTDILQERSGTVSSRQASVRRGSQTVQPLIASVPSHSMLQGGPGGLSGNFRDRIDSNRVGERPRARTASKALERMRSESGNGGRGFSATSSLDITDTKLVSGDLS